MECRKKRVLRTQRRGAPFRRGLNSRYGSINRARAKLPSPASFIRAASIKNPKRTATCVASPFDHARAIAEREVRENGLPKNCRVIRSLAERDENETGFSEGRASWKARAESAVLLCTTRQPVRSRETPSGCATLSNRPSWTCDCNRSVASYGVGSRDHCTHCTAGARNGTKTRKPTREKRLAYTGGGGASRGSLAP